MNLGGNRRWVPLTIWKDNRLKTSHEPSAAFTTVPKSIFVPVVEPAVAATGPFVTTSKICKNNYLYTFITLNMLVPYLLQITSIKLNTHTFYLTKFQLIIFEVVIHTN